MKSSDGMWSFATMVVAMLMLLQFAFQSHGPKVLDRIIGDVVVTLIAADTMQRRRYYLPPCIYAKLV